MLVAQLNSVVLRGAQLLAIGACLRINDVGLHQVPHDSPQNQK